MCLLKLSPLLPSALTKLLLVCRVQPVEIVTPVTPQPVHERKFRKREEGEEGRRGGDDTQSIIEEGR